MSPITASSMSNPCCCFSALTNTCVPPALSVDSDPSRAGTVEAIWYRPSASLLSSPRGLSSTRSDSSHSSSSSFVRWEWGEWA